MASAIGGIARLAADLPLDHDRGVGRQHRQRRIAGAHRERLGARHAQHVVGGTLARQQRLVDVGDRDAVRDAELRQELRAPRRGGGEAQERWGGVGHQSR